MLQQKKLLKRYQLFVINSGKSKDVKKEQNDDVTEWISRSSKKINLLLTDDKKPAKLKTIQSYSGIIYVLEFNKNI